MKERKRCIICKEPLIFFLINSESKRKGVCNTCNELIEDEIFYSKVAKEQKKLERNIDKFIHSHHQRGKR